MEHAENPHKRIVKKRTQSKDFGALTLTFVIFDVMDVYQDVEDGTTEIYFSQVFNVLETWDFERWGHAS